MDSERPGQDRVAYSPLAADDFSATHDHTAHQWGWDQAERYADFLEEAVLEIARDPQNGKLIDGHAAARAVFVKWPAAKYGHYIIYRETVDGIYILRILHSAMDIPGHIREQKGQFEG
jgi:plasmid stabilization system protein ParE